MDFKNGAGMRLLFVFCLGVFAAYAPVNAASIAAPLILAPSDGINSSLRSIAVNVTFPADEGNSSITINYYINGKLNQSSKANTTINVSDGFYALNVSLTDGLNYSENSTAGFYIDTKSPIIYSFNGNVANNASISKAGLINVTATDSGTGIYSMIFAVGNKNFTARKDDIWWVAELDPKNFTQGAYNVTATAEDFAGNTGISHVVISEALFDAIGSDNGRVWVELYNPTDFPVNLSGWSIKGGNRIITIPDFFIGRKSAVVIANASNFKADYGFAPDMDLLQGDFDFTNSNDFIQLRNASKKVIDELSWGNNAGGAYNWSLFANEGMSISRNPAGSDSNLQDDWEPNATPTPRIPANPDFITVFLDNNSAPYAAAPLPYITFAEDSYGESIDLSQYFGDADDDELSFGYVSNDSNVYAEIYRNNTIRIISSLNWNGIAGITIAASDGSLTASQSLIVEVTSVNDAPVLSIINNITANENDLADINSTGNIAATDADGDDLKFTYSYPLNSSGKWKTGYEDSGDYYVNITAYDGNGGSDSKTALIRIIDKIKNIPINNIEKLNRNRGSNQGSNDGSASYVCNKDWACSEWSKCDYGLQLRECRFKKVPQHSQNSPCPDASHNPATKKECEIKKDDGAVIVNNDAAKEENEGKTEKINLEGSMQKSEVFSSVTGDAALGINNPLGGIKWMKQLSTPLLIAATSALGILGYEFIKKKLKKVST